MKFSKIFLISLVLILLFGFVWADSNGIWHKAEDIVGGIFGSDENPYIEFTFLGKVFFKKDIEIDGKLKLGNYTTSNRPICDLNNYGVMIYQTDEKRPYVCTNDGDKWKPLDSDYDKDGIVDWMDPDDNDPTKIHENIIPGNIKKGVNIFGIEGELVKATISVNGKEGFQEIDSQSPWASEYFEINGEKYLAVTNYMDKSRSYGNYMDFRLNSDIYKWDGNKFQYDQSIPTRGAEEFAYFEINGEHYLFVGNGVPGTGACASSVGYSSLFKWNGNSFVKVQDISTSGYSGSDFFKIGENYYLGIANGWTASCSNYVNSNIYRWNGNSFQLIQSILNHGTDDLEYFEVGSEKYIAYISQSSRIMKWNGNKFVDYSNSISELTQSPVTFKIQGNTYLVGKVDNDNSKAYKWNDVSNKFDEFQIFKTKGVGDWHYFEKGNIHYILVANRAGASKIYMWNSEIQEFEEVQWFDSNDARNWEHFEIGEKFYIAISNYNSNVVIYEVE